MQESTKSIQPPSLEALRTMFDQIRNGPDGKRRHLPNTFKERAVSAVKDGLSIASVAEACGVDRKSLAMWVRTMSKPKARVLKVCEASASSEEEPIVKAIASVVTINLFFPNGVVAELSTKDGANVLREIGGLKSC